MATNLDAMIAEAAREAVAAALHEQCASSEFLHQGNAPIGRRAFLQAARAGKFPARKVGRRVVARREDFEKWIASHPSAARVVSDTATDEDALLAKLGLERRAP